MTVTVTNTVSLAHAIYAAWGFSPTGWETNGLATFPLGFGETTYTNASSQGATHVKAFCDLNGNGEYDAGNDILLVRTIPYGGSAKVDFKFGDVDGDGFSDALERNEGTDPFDAGSYCFNLSQTYTGVFQTTNALTFAAYFGTNRVYGPCVAEGNVWTNDFGHRVATSGEKASVSVWDDANQNGEYDVGETSNRYVIAVTGHDMVVTNTLSYGNFDRNGNTLPDWWEDVTGLSMVTNGGLYADTDSDGLINLHEYWAGTDPLTPDGSNTFLSVVSRSIDDRIKDKSPAGTLQKFLNYHVNGTNGVFDINPECWANDIDTSCVSMWNNSSGSLQAGVAISKRHIIVAGHFYHGNGVKVFFREPNVNIHTNVVTGRFPVNGTDIMVQSLRDELPDAITPARILSANYRHFIGLGKWLPVLRFDKNEQSIVCEISKVLPSEAHYKTGIREQSVSTSTPSKEFRQPFYIHTHGGDSGNPLFVVVGNDIVLLGAFHGGIYEPDGITVKVGQCPFVTYYAAEIQSAMDYLIQGYTLQYFDCSPYQAIIRQEVLP